MSVCTLISNGHVKVSALQETACLSLNSNFKSEVTCTGRSPERFLKILERRGDCSAWAMVLQ
jgi:hypothetical protein